MITRWSLVAGRWGVTTVSALLLAVFPPCHIAAQVIPPTIDTMPSDSARADSLRKDATERLLAAEENTGRTVAMAPDLGSEGPRAFGRPRRPFPTS